MPIHIIRPMRLEDYDALIALWRRAGLPYEAEGRDSRASFQKQLCRFGPLMFVATCDGEVIGSVIGSHDGRKGWINRLAVDPPHRRRGLAKRLIRAVEQALQEQGIPLAAALVEEGNVPSRALFILAGYEERRDILYYRKVFGESQTEP